MTKHTVEQFQQLATLLSKHTQSVYSTLMLNRNGMLYKPVANLTRKRHYSRSSPDDMRHTTQ